MKVLCIYQLVTIDRFLHAFVQNFLRLSEPLNISAFNGNELFKLCSEVGADHSNQSMAVGRARMGPMGKKNSPPPPPPPGPMAQVMRRGRVGHLPMLSFDLIMLFILCKISLLILINVVHFRSSTFLGVLILVCEQNIVPAS